MIYSIDSDAVTLVAASATKGALGTIKLINGFFNPPNSKVNAIILRSIVATKSGTPAGPFLYNYINLAAGVVCTNTVTGTIQQGYLLGGQPSLMVPEVNVALTVTGGATTALTQLCTIGGPAAIAAGAGIYSSEDDEYFPIPSEIGNIIVPPGTIFGITGTGVGTSHIVQSTLWWLEKPLAA